MSKQKGIWILIATILGSSMAFIDSSVVNVALPRLQIELQAGASSVQWVVEAYALFLGALILIGGSLGDQFGRKRIFLLGVIIFALASVFCGISQNIEQLIIARSVQGIGGALLTPGSLAIIRSSFDSAERGKAIGTWSGFSAITSALGPLLGGWLVQNTSWRWIFFINIPLAIIVLMVSLLHLPESTSGEGKKHLDFPGAILTALGLGGVVYGLIQAENVGFADPIVLVCIFGGLIALGLFLFVESRSRAPMMPLILFRSRTFSGTNLLTLLLYAALGGALFFLPFNLISAQGYTATAAGASLLPFTLLSFSLSRWSGGLVAKYGSRLPLIIGPSIAALGFVLFALPGLGGSYWFTYFPAIVVLGLGMTVTIAPLTTTVMGAVEDQYSGTASGVNNAVARIAGLLAIAILGICVAFVFTSSLTSNIASLHLSAGLQQTILAQHNRLTGIDIPNTVQGATHTAIRNAIDESFIAGFRVAMLISAGLAFGSAVCAWLFVSSPAKLPKHTGELQSGDNACTLTFAHQRIDGRSESEPVAGRDVTPVHK
ncbi:MAG: MFS transporter [Ktedonobacteraceae bacterium]